MNIKIFSLLLTPLLLIACGSGSDTDSNNSDPAAENAITEVKQRLTEPEAGNDAFNDASPISIGTEIIGTLTEGVDVRDYYSFSAGKNSNLKITLSGDNKNDFDLSLADPDFAEVSSSESENSDETISYKTPAAGQYNLLVDTVSGSGEYTLTVLEQQNIKAVKNSNGEFIFHHVYSSQRCIEVTLKRQTDADAMANQADFFSGRCPSRYSGTRCTAIRSTISRDVVFIPSFPDKEKSAICRANDNSLAGTAG